jgi:DNA-binding NtrC family response regulator
MSTRAGDTEALPSIDAAQLDRIPKIWVVRGPSAGRAFAMTRQVATVGRHATNDLVVADPRVSGAHLELRRQGESLLVRDSQTTNGTWLGAHRITEILLAEGGELTIGDSTIRFETETSDAPAPTTTNETVGQLVGTSSAMREVFATIERVAAKDLSVLVQGETGSGKEEVARAIHGASPRAQMPFVVIDATSLPETLAESLLFGHEKGAFTGATERRIGFFEAATGGTVFIDEIGELPQPLQSKFLRVLERHEVVRVGGHTPSKVDVRVLAATNRDLRVEIDRGRFREDLYFRLAQVKITLPPLRDRREDIPLLARKLLSESPTPVMIDKTALDHLREQSWPGNVRELKNVLVRAAALAQDGIIRRADVVGESAESKKGSEIDFLSTFSSAKDKAIERFETAYLEALMRRTAGNLSKASREADIARHHLRDLLKKRGLYNMSFGEPE